MPFRAMVQDGALAPEDVEFLQAIYDAAVERVTDLDDRTKHDAVNTLLNFYRAGERDRGKLIARVTLDLQRTAR
ncbi:MAG: hypothetical protein J0H84_25665 [Rhizobiales bacterium]|nr:hypothetical protein [Hyphomicrobiales bacterium]